MFEVCLIVFICYVPGLNHAIMLDGIKTELCLTGLWIIPVIVIDEEIRKAIIRKWPKGWVARITAY